MKTTSWVDFWRQSAPTTMSETNTQSIKYVKPSTKWQLKTSIKTSAHSWTDFLSFSSDTLASKYERIYETTSTLNKIRTTSAVYCRYDAVLRSHLHSTNLKLNDWLSHCHKLHLLQRSFSKSENRKRLAKANLRDRHILRFPSLRSLTQKKATSVLVSKQSTKGEPVHQGNLESK